MKQRVRVAGIVRRAGEILLLERAAGRAETMPKYELPTGKIYFGEQPEEAMARILYDYAGAKTDSLKLIDAITFTDLKGASELANLYIVYEIELTGDSVKITTERYSALAWTKDTDVKEIPVDEASLAVLEIVHSRRSDVVKNTEYRGDEHAATIYVDGGSRGNPGPSGVGYYIVAPDKRVLKKGGEFLGFSTSRMAEYYALKEGIEQALELGLKSANFKSDSLMLVNQMNGVYKVKNRDLMPIYEDILRLLEGLQAYSFEHISREDNKEADREVNVVIDENQKSRGE